MGYVGNEPTSNFTSVAKDVFSGDGSTTAFTLSKASTTNGVAVFVENVRQEPTTAYAVSGTTLTFTAAPVSASGNNIYVLHHNAVASTANHPAAQDLTAVKGTFTGTVTAGSTLDMNGTELILDADADTSITADTDDRIDFKTGGSDRMKINSNGSVGIASTVTTGDLNIGAGVGSYPTIQMTSGGTTTGNIIYFGDSSDADYSAITAFGSGAGETGRMRFTAGTQEAFNLYNNGTFRHTANYGGLAGYIVNEHGSSPYGIYIQFDTASPDNADNYFIRLIDSSATKGTWYSDGDIATADGGSVNSDSKLKDRITDATDKWDDVKKLKVRNFYWKESYLPKKKDKKLIGFIAQEVETVFPGLVWEQKDTEPVTILYTEDDQEVKDGIKNVGEVKSREEKDLGTVTKTLKESKFIPILTKALQEAMERIETLEAKVKALEDA